MSYTTWTAEELLSNLKRRSGDCWRIVEAQHVNSTIKLVDDLEEQRLLESLLEESKPPYPVECEGLDYLLYTPFRYKPYKGGSRFRRAGQLDGVFYGSEYVHTALAEKAFYSLLFYTESPDTPLPDNPVQQTAFKIRYNSRRAIDLTLLPLNENSSEWTHPTNYEPCQFLADEARKAKIEVIKSKSVRCLQQDNNISLLSCKAFESSQPEETQTWHFTIQLCFGRYGFSKIPYRV